MVKINPAQIDEELQKQEEEFGDGESSISGSAAGGKAMDIDAEFEKAIGNAPRPKQSLNIAKEIEDDENAINRGTEEEFAEDHNDGDNEPQTQQEE